VSSQYHPAPVTAIAYDSETALLVVDIQNDFADPAGSLYVDGGHEIVPLVNAHIAEARAAGAAILYSADWHPSSTPHFEKDGGIWPVHCVADTWGSEFHPDLVVDRPVVHNGVRGEDGYSAFTTRDPLTEETVPTEMPELLRRADVTTVVIAGLATDYCVRWSALDAIAEGYAVRVLTDAVRAVDLQLGDGARALAEIEAAGAELL
jgi:nicotinamidase/pyrazinamidase